MTGPAHHAGTRSKPDHVGVTAARPGRDRQVARLRNGRKEASGRPPPVASRPMVEAGSLEVRLLGGVQLLSSGAPVPVTGIRRRTLLALLALRCGEPVSTDLLIDVLWGDTADAGALHNLRANVSNLRKSLGEHASVLTTRASAYVLDLDPDAVDALRFERLAASGRAAIRRDEPEVGVDELRRALAVWRGDPLVDLLGTDLMEREADRLRHVHLAAF